VTQKKSSERGKYFLVLLGVTRFFPRVVIKSSFCFVPFIITVFLKIFASQNFSYNFWIKLTKKILLSFKKYKNIRGKTVFISPTSYNYIKNHHHNKFSSREPKNRIKVLLLSSTNHSPTHTVWEREQKHREFHS
jgi:hypothetical protein